MILYLHYLKKGYFPEYFYLVDFENYSKSDEMCFGKSFVLKKSAEL